MNQSIVRPLSQFNRKFLNITARIEDIHEMMKIMMNKLDKLDVIEERLKTFENDMNDVKDSVEYAHA
jgi:translation elongation factor EF-1alpha